MLSVPDSIVAAVRNQYEGNPDAERRIIGVSGPQGSGKTTVTREAAEQLTTQHNIPTVSLSLDDFYWPYGNAHSRGNWGDPSQGCRGLPGTHDVQLLLKFCNDFLSRKSHQSTGKNGELSSLTAPTYDKSLHNGLGDRSGFVSVPESTKVVLLEGWMLGFKPVDENTIDLHALANDTVKPTKEGVHEINARLAEYLDVWKLVSSWVRLVPEHLQYVYDWRLQQEHDMIRLRGTGMTDSQVREFVDKYMPCYKLYMKTLDSLPASTIKFSINKNHEATQVSR